MLHDFDQRLISLCFDIIMLYLRVSVLKYSAVSGTGGEGGGGGWGGGGGRGVRITLIFLIFPRYHGIQTQPVSADLSHCAISV